MKTTSQILTEAIEMIPDKKLRELIKEALDQWLEEQANILKIKT
mgnify:CR=1 FL=1